MPPTEVPTINVPLNPTTVPQQWAIAPGEGQLPDGSPVPMAFIRIQWPLITGFLALDAMSWFDMRKQMDALFGDPSGLEIAREVPPSNGQGPSGPPGPLRGL